MVCPNFCPELYLLWQLRGWLPPTAAAAAAGTYIKPEPGNPIKPEPGVAIKYEPAFAYS
jgi:hypothetical protein